MLKFNNFFNFYYDAYILRLTIFGIKISRKRRYNNGIFIIRKDGSRKKVKKIRGLKIKFGSINNQVLIYEPIQKFKNFTIEIDKNSKIVIREKGDSALEGIENTRVFCRGGVDICFGKSLYIGSLFAFVDHGSLSIGDNCMFSSEVTIRGGDGHAIYDKLAEQAHNTPAHIVIGDHVWLGHKSILLKKAYIPKNSIVGIGSVVTKAFQDENIIIAGNPAKKVKENISWEKEQPVFANNTEGDA